MNDYAHATAAYAEAIALEEVRLGRDHDDILGLLSIQAGLELKMGHAKAAEGLLRRELDTITRTRGMDRRETASVMDHLAEALSQQDRKAEAAELRQRPRKSATSCATSAKNGLPTLTDFRTATWQGTCLTGDCSQADRLRNKPPPIGNSLPLPCPP